jgi:acyl carrier protein
MSSCISLGCRSFFLAQFNSAAPKPCDYQSRPLISVGFRVNSILAGRTDRPPQGMKRKMLTCSGDIQKRIIALVNSILTQNAITAEVNAESLLVDVGLNSVDMVNLMLGVEAEFDFTIPQAEITPENFQSVKTLKQMIVAQLRPGIG